MNPSRVRQKIARGEPVICAKACYQDPDLVELMGNFGFDAIWICLEHRRLDPAAVHSLLQACRLSGADALIRIKPANYADLLWILESGARGIMLPRVRHPDEVRAVVESMKFPPLGRRGYDGIHADADFGLKSAALYMAEANRETFLAVQIEEPEVVPHIEEIAAIPGVDVLFVGPSDLTLGMGKLGQIDSPEVVAVIDRTIEACRRHGKVAGCPCSIDDAARHIQRGLRLLNVASDWRCVVNGLRQTVATAAKAGLKLNAM